MVFGNLMLLLRMSFVLFFLTASLHSPSKQVMLEAGGGKIWLMRIKKILIPVYRKRKIEIERGCGYVVLVVHVLL